MPKDFTRTFSIHYFHIPDFVNHVYLKLIAVSIPLKHTQPDSSIKLKKQFIQTKLSKIQALSVKVIKTLF